jgi:hypothetical protein
VVTSRTQNQLGKLFVAALRLLQANDVGPRCTQPIDQSFLALAQRIDIPGNNLHDSLLGHRFRGTCFQTRQIKYS